MRTHTSQPLSRDDRGFRTLLKWLREKRWGFDRRFAAEESIARMDCRGWTGANQCFLSWQKPFLSKMTAGWFSANRVLRNYDFFRTSSITSEKLSRARTLSQTQQPDIQDVNPRWTFIPRLFHCGDYNISSKVIRFFWCSPHFTRVNIEQYWTILNTCPGCIFAA